MTLKFLFCQSLTTVAVIALKHSSRLKARSIAEQRCTELTP
ncbi:hypothetical protein [Rheinheimera lutimaris]|nr:hypothetical protein [Rheinheimera lutimaris]